MPKRPATGRGLFYTRDSGGEHENTPGEYVRWAQRETARLGVAFAGAPAGIEAMIREGRCHDGDLFLDYGVQGNRLERPGLDALFRVALADLSVSHVLMPRRDRLARPDDPLDAMRLEAMLREGGLTLVFMDKVLPPLARGRRDIGESIVALIDYDRAGNDRRELAQKILYAQLALAKAGFSTGGRPPYGFRRWLVQAGGAPVRQLAEGEYVRMAGHHVVWLPGPQEEVDVIGRILTLLETKPAARVAALLTAEGVPTPDALRLRTDRGVKHPTSGVWHQQTVVNIARNPLLRVVTQYGRRSMGDRLRFTPEGPRELGDADYRADSKPKVIVNPEGVRVTAPARFAPLVDPRRHEALLGKLDERAGTQRGKPRSQDPARNPLGGRVYDLSCGWPLYRQPFKESFRYLCGLYQQSHGERCKHNHVDGVQATRFLLACVRQRLLAPGLRERLEKKLRAIAGHELSQGRPDAAPGAPRAMLAEVRRKLGVAGENLALAESPDQRRAVAAVFDQLKRQEKTLEAELGEMEQALGRARDLDAEVDAALAVLDGMAELAAQAHDLSAVGRLFQGLNARLFFRFTEARLAKRVVNTVAGGVVTFGATPPPVALYEGPTGRRHVKGREIPPGTAGPRSAGAPGVPGSVPGGEGDSLGNVSRGERI